MKNTTIIKKIAIFGLAVFMFNVSQAQSKNKQQKNIPLQVSELIQKWMPMKMERSMKVKSEEG